MGFGTGFGIFEKFWVLILFLELLRNFGFWNFFENFGKMLDFEILVLEHGVLMFSFTVLSLYKVCMRAASMPEHA